METAELARHRDEDESRPLFRTATRAIPEALAIMDSAALLGNIRDRLAEVGEADAAVLTKEEALSLISEQ
jgi:hypothetical protein